MLNFCIVNIQLLKYFLVPCECCDQFGNLKIVFKKYEKRFASECGTFDNFSQTESGRNLNQNLKLSLQNLKTSLENLDK